MVTSPAQQRQLRELQEGLDEMLDEYWVEEHAIGDLIYTHVRHHLNPLPVIGMGWDHFEILERDRQLNILAWLYEMQLEAEEAGIEDVLDDYCMQWFCPVFNVYPHLLRSQD